MASTQGSSIRISGRPSNTRDTKKVNFHEEIEEGSEYDSTQLSTEDDQDEGEEEGYEDYQERSHSMHKFSKLTSDERALSAAMDQERNGNLALHLYATHRLKRLARRSDLTRDEVLYDHKQSWSENPGKTQRFYPPQSWTQWPLLADEVPREWERWGTSATSVPSLRAPSAWAQELLTAAIQRIAREQFNGRTWRKSIPSRQAEYGDATALRPTGPRRTFSTPVRYRTQLLADEDTALTLIRPHVRSVLSNLDTLLLALHSSREAQHTEHAARKANLGRYRYFWQAELRQSLHKDKPEVEAEAEAHKKFEDGSRKRTDSEISASDLSSTEDNDSTISKRKMEHQYASSKIARHPRDWLEVLGIAGQIGVSPAVLQRAAERCKVIFQEDAQFNTVLPNGQMVDGFAPPNIGAAMDESGEYLGGIRRDRFLEPFGPSPRLSRLKARAARWRKAKDRFDIHALRVQYETNQKLEETSSNSEEDEEEEEGNNDDDDNSEANFAGEGTDTDEDRGLEEGDQTMEDGIKEVRAGEKSSDTTSNTSHEVTDESQSSSNEESMSASDDVESG